MIVASTASLSGARVAFITTSPPPCLTPMEAPGDLYRKMHIPDDPLYATRNIISLPAIWASRPLIREVRTHGNPRLLGPVVSRRRPPHGSAARCKYSFFIPRLSAGTRTKRLNSAWRSMMHGALFNAHTPSPTASLSAWSTAWEHEFGDIRGNRAQGKAGLKFWGGSFLCDPFGRIIAEASA